MLDVGLTTFMILATSLVMLMTPGLAFFYGGLGCNKNILSLTTLNGSFCAKLKINLDYKEKKQLMHTFSRKQIKFVSLFKPFSVCKISIPGSMRRIRDHILVLFLHNSHLALLKKKN
mgnify:CR=1 FL=1